MIAGVTNFRGDSGMMAIMENAPGVCQHAEAATAGEAPPEYSWRLGGPV